MKAVIQGLRYDTEKADKIGEITGTAYTPSVGEEARFDWKEALWMTPTRRFFLEGEGTPKTRWFRLSAPDNRFKQGDVEIGRALRALSEEEARTWVEKYCSADVYEQLWDVDDA